MRRPRARRYERYAFEDSPWVQKLTQRDLAKLLGTTKDRLEALIRDKEQWISRRPEMIAGKERQLAIPRGKLRAVHERLKYHLNKIKQPDYLYSPRKGRAQRDNAAHHVGQRQYFSLDIRQFYPSTTDEDVFRWAYYTAGLSGDVAGMITKLVCIDRKMPFGSVVSPILTSLVHRPMFDNAYAVCRRYGLRMSLWVDDLVVSGHEITGTVVDELRNVIRKGGFNTHKIRFRGGGRPVGITGVPVDGGRVVAPLGVHERVRNGYAAVRASTSDTERAANIDRLLSALGTYRYHVGASTEQGRKAADQMHALRQRRAALSITAFTLQSPVLATALGNANTNDPPWR